MNQHIPIARLPPEVLGHVFTCLIAIMDKRPPQALHGVKSLGKNRWLLVTHVCHHWREVALRTPVLWTNISVEYGSVEGVEAFITRSGKVPLRVKVGNITNIERWQGTLQLLAGEMSRVEECELCVSEDTWKAFVQHFPPTVPLLRSLVIRVDGTIEPATREALSLLLSRSAAPCLKTLKVSFFMILWKKIVLPQSLTCLEVNSSKGGFSLEPGPNVAAAIGYMPVLQKLQLLHVLAPLHDHQQSLPSVISPVTLPRLRLLHISASALACVHFVDHLIILGDAAIHLHFHDYPANAASLLVPPLSSKMVSLEGPLEDLDRQMIRAVSLEKSELVFYKYDNPPTNQPSRYRLQIQFSSPMVQSGVPLSDLCSNLPLQNVSFLQARHMTCEKEVQPSWTNMLSAMSNIQTLHFLSPDIEPDDLIALLCARAGVPEERLQQPTFLLPNLKVLILEQVHFQTINAYHGSTSFAYALQDEIIARKKAGHQLEKVIVSQCVNMNDEDIKVLVEVVPVDWDESVEFESFDSENDEDSYDESVDTSDESMDTYHRNGWIDI